ncbi:hypothetical protein BGZ61DRAFT_521918 [Ilyonectria robusta]|uniref:uncharacterized protein n=1 Tax=Ilyonectria robusta TaxID=1079257 RepID=UPI001E8D2608|nr:uncharacterized protein BGZ61DRAFT_521918 [Ilyonectria robusta]KAH8670084.1 hypothetical protein BGZ61DRAFT_521918 [Ilyonectria robusta]
MGPRARTAKGTAPPSNKFPSCDCDLKPSTNLFRAWLLGRLAFCSHRRRPERGRTSFFLILVVPVAAQSLIGSRAPVRAACVLQTKRLFSFPVTILHIITSHAPCYNMSAVIVPNTPSTQMHIDVKSQRRCRPHDLCFLLKLTIISRCIASALSAASLS